MLLSPSFGRERSRRWGPVSRAWACGAETDVVQGFQERGVVYRGFQVLSKASKKHVKLITPRPCVFFFFK